MKNIKDLLLKNEEQQPELEIFLSTFFENSTQNEPNKIIHGNCLTVDYFSDKSKIKSIFFNSNTELEEKLIAEANNALYSNNGKEIGSKYVHCISMVNGYFRYEDKFLVLPAPPSAPQPNSLYADHAFKIEYSFCKSNYWQINEHRSNKMASEIILMLNSLLRHGIKLKNRSTIHEWAFVLKEGIISSEYLQMDYLPGDENRLKDNDGYTIVSNYPILQRKPAKTYYQSYGVDANDMENLILPNNIEDSLSILYNLEEEKRKLFLRSSYWTQVAHRIFSISWSASYASLITAIEVFLPNPDAHCKICNKPVSSDHCPECNQPLSGPTKYFRDFVEKYSPGINKSDRNKLYEVRSSISHGGYLLPGDTINAWVQFNPINNQARQLWDMLSHIVQIVQINWLHSQ